ncbi:MAG: ATPase [Lachnospiraceae bacterium]|jgi:vacuolar-type H+-ATPase subunit H|nr:ATPase [Lachnospiraceae bacterium]
MSSSRIEQIIEEIEEYVENCRYQPLSTTKIIVNKEELEELLRELRLKTPDEIKRYQKIIGNKDAILADAQSKANNIIEDAKKQAQKLVQDTEIMKAAYAQANDTVNEANKQAQGILDSAESDAENIRSSAINYTDQILSNISTIMGNAIADVGEKYNEFATSIQSYYDLVNENRSELSPMQNNAHQQAASDDEANNDDSEDADNE